MFSVKVLGSVEETREAVEALFTWADELDLVYAWAGEPETLENTVGGIPFSKVRRAVIGESFGQTHPDFLDQLLDEGSDTLRIHESDGGVFHPKLAVGRSKDETQAIFGSSNFTGGGFGRNTELNVKLHGSPRHPEIDELEAFVDRCWSEADPIDRDWLDRYREEKYREVEAIAPPSVDVEFEPNGSEEVGTSGADGDADDEDVDRAGLPDTGDYDRPSPPRPVPPGDVPAVADNHDLNVEWDEYFEKLKSNSVSGYTVDRGFFGDEPVEMRQLGEHIKAFEKYDSFADMPQEKRQILSGFGATLTGHFGSMEGAGSFKGYVNREPEKLGDPLESHIPLTGTVTIDSARKYLEEVTDVKGVAIGSASRLLLAKRPDCFMCVNGANEDNLRASFDLNPQTIEGYLDLHRILWSFPWATADKPEAGSVEQKVWRARIGLVDAFFYDRAAR